MSRYYITTPIYYPSGEPHLGHVYTTTAADVIARYHRLMGDKTFFLTGTDEHGIKMVKTAEKRQTTPGELADLYSAKFQSVFTEFKFANDDFIRTTQQRHKDNVQEIVRRLLANGDIYLGSYEGWYDEGEENFVTETEAKANEYKSPVSGRPLTRYQEQSYFLRLTKYQDQLLKYIEGNPGFIRPESRRNEVLSKLQAGVSDLSISRNTLKWGIPMPNDPNHVLYVWVDALSNYITALGYPTADPEKFKTFWPVNVHLIGKEILWFHAVYWPIMLMSLGIDLPQSIFAHGWWTVKERKMSKSLGNFIGIEDLRHVIDRYSLDGLRYYLLRAAPFGNDLEWNDDELARSFSELADVVGNCLNRTLNMVGKYRNGVIPGIGTADATTDEVITAPLAKFREAYQSAYGRLELQAGAMLPIELARAANAYIDATRPFSLAKDPAQAQRLDTVLHHAACAIGTALVGLLPLLPEKAKLGLEQMGISTDGKSFDELLAMLKPGLQLQKGSPLFPKPE